jgi:tetratricopeptide (TPR) repeat protein
MPRCSDSLTTLTWLLSKTNRKTLGIEYSEGAPPALRRRSKAEELFRCATTLEPDSNLLARRWRLLGETISEEELSYRRKLISDAFSYWGYSLISTGDLSHRTEALTATLKATQLDPASALAFGNLAIVMDLLGREKAEEHHQKAVELSMQPDTRWISNSLTVSAYLLWYVGRFEDALDRAQKGIESYENSNGYMGYLSYDVKARLLVMEGKANEAIDLLNGVMERHPWLTNLGSEMARARMEVLLVDAQVSQKPHFDEELVKDLVAYIEDAITLAPDDAYPWFLLGHVRSLQGDFGAAVEAYERAVEREPTNAGYRVYLAYCSQKTNHPDEHKEHIEKAREMVEESEGGYRYHRACLAAVEGQKDEALDLLEAALEQRHESPAWAQYDPALEPIRHLQRFGDILSTRTISQQSV